MVPPLADTVALPVLVPKQFTFTWAAIVELNAAVGWVIVTLPVVVQPFASEMVQIQLPAERAFALAVFCAGVVFQL
jgi:hypothetical protein